MRKLLTDEEKKAKKAQYDAMYYAQNKEKRKQAYSNYYSRNKEKCLRYAREYAKKDREGAYKRRYKSNLMKYYNLSLEEYRQMFDSQSGMCAICGRDHKLFNRPLSIDHDHKTGAVRGLLCQRCNILISKYDDNPEIFKRVVYYLEKQKP